MTRTRKRSDPEPKRERRGVLSSLERFALFVAGVAVGATVSRVTSRAVETKVESPPREAEALPLRDPSALPQAEAWAEQPMHEKSEVNLRFMVITLTLLVAGAILVHVGLWWWVKESGATAGEDPKKGSSLAETALGLPAGYPKLQISPERDLQEFLWKEEQRLKGDGGGNTSNGAVRLPLGQAMQIIAKDGVPTFGAADGRRLSPLDLQHQRVEEGGPGR